MLYAYKRFDIMDKQYEINNLYKKSWIIVLF